MYGNLHLRVITRDIVSFTHKEVVVRRQEHSSMFPSGISVTLRLLLSFYSFFSSAPIVRSYIASFSSVTNETKIKCKWKFIAAGDRRRFRTFKYFINFLLLLASPSFLSPSLVFVVPTSAWRASVTIERVLWKGTRCSQERSENFIPMSIFFFYLALQKMKTFAM